MKFKLRDVIIIASILVVALVTVLVMTLSKEPGESVSIEINGVEVDRISLSEDGVYSLNGGTHILCISGGEAYLLSAACPDHLCVGFGKISYNGESIACVPYQLMITVSSKKVSDVELES